MKQIQQPETTSNSDERGAPIQISEAELKGDFWKSTKIWRGMDRSIRTRYPDWSNRLQDNRGFVELASIIANLTSQDKRLREAAKKEVRELVKLGEEEMVSINWKPY